MFVLVRTTLPSRTRAVLICGRGRVVRGPFVSRPSGRDSRLRRMRFDRSDARRPRTRSLVILAPDGVVGRRRSVAGVSSATRCRRHQPLARVARRDVGRGSRRGVRTRPTNPQPTTPATSQHRNTPTKPHPARREPYERPFAAVSRPSGRDNATQSRVSTARTRDKKGREPAAPAANITASVVRPVRPRSRRRRGVCRRGIWCRGGVRGWGCGPGSLRRGRR